MAWVTELLQLLGPSNWKIGLINSKSLLQNVLPGIRMVEEQINKTGNVYNVTMQSICISRYHGNTGSLPISELHVTVNVQDRQCTYYVTQRHIRAITVEVGMSLVLHILSVFEAYGTYHEMHVHHSHHWLLQIYFISSTLSHKGMHFESY